jgi:hypothetical protein
MRVNASDSGIFARKKVTSELQRSREESGRCAAGGRGTGKQLNRAALEWQDRSHLLKLGQEIRQTGQNRLRGMSLRKRRSGATIGAADCGLRLFHFGPHGMQVIGGRDHGEKQNQGAAQGAKKDHRMSGQSLSPNGRGRRTLLPPQKVGGQHKREPTKVKKKLHTQGFRFSRTSMRSI